jgi:hypothetical protein
MNWQEIENNQVKVCYVGPFDEYYAKMDARLFKLSLFATRRTYDKKNNKTITIYKRGLK